MVYYYLSIHSVSLNARHKEIIGGSDGFKLPTRKRFLLTKTSGPDGDAGLLKL